MIKHDLLFQYGNNALVLHADCRSTNSGLFSGLIFLVSMLIALIIYFILDSSEGCDDIEMSSMINKTFESIMTSVLIVATIWVRDRVPKTSAKRGKVNLKEIDNYRAPTGVLYLYKRYIAALKPICKLYRSLISYIVLYVL